MSPLLLAALLIGQPAPAPGIPGGSLVVLGVDARAEQADSVLIVRTAGIAAGRTFSRTMFQAEVADAVRRIYGLGLFEQVTVDTAMLGDGVTVTFTVTEFPRLARLDFEGFRRIKLKDLEARVKARPGAIVSDKQVFDWRQEVLKLYKEKGYLLVQVEALVGEPDSSGRVPVTIQVEEGDPVRIRDIELVGNENFPDEKIEITLTNRQKEWYRKARLNEEEFVKDLDRIVDFYKQRGFLDARVLDYSMEFDQGWASITIEIEEGGRFYFGTVRFEGDSVFPPDSLERLVRFKQGTPYNTKLAEATLADIYGLYSEQGYIYASVVPIEETRGDTVDITYQVAEGAPALVRLVMIEGNEQTHDKVIRRQVSSLPGYTFKRSEVIRSQRDIFNLGFFEDVSLDYRKADTTGAIDLIYRVKEKGFFGTVGAGVTYSGPEGITGYLELQQPNLFGRGQQASIKVEMGGRKTNFQVSYSEPWLYDTPTSAGVDAAWLTRKYDYYDKQEISGGLSFSRPLPLDYARAYLGLRVTDAIVPPTSISSGYDPGENNPYDVRKDTVHKTAFIPSITLTRDSRDYIFNPTTGSAITYTLSTSVGDIRYHRHVLDAAHYFPLFWKFSLMGRTRLGYITGFSASDEVPLYERFYAGGTGPDGIRGYGDRTIGPRQGGYAVGGRALALFSMEYKLRINPQLSFLAFADAGNTWETIDQFSLSDLKRGAGLGVRLEIPMLGLLGFDFGYGFDREGGGRWEPHFQVGRTF